MNSNTLLDQALALHRSGHLSDAEALYARAAAADPRDVAALKYLGVVRAQQGRGAEALQALDAALAIRPGDDETILNRANVLQMLGRHAEALAGFDHALRAAPASAQLLNNRASALADLGRIAEALESYDRAVALAPAFTPASEFATAMPRSLWQCTEKRALSEFGTASRSRLSIAKYSSGTV